MTYPPRSDITGPFVLDWGNTDTRYQIVDNLYNEHRTIGGVKRYQPATTELESETDMEWLYRLIGFLTFLVALSIFETIWKRIWGGHDE